MRIRSIALTLVGGGVAAFAVAAAMQASSGILGPGVVPALAHQPSAVSSSQATTKPSASGSSVNPSNNAAKSCGALSGSLSANWAGYVDTSQPYVGVSASFTVPDVSQAAPVSSVAEWVGIGGLGSSSGLIQAGVLENYQDGQLQAQAFTESLPAQAKTGQTVSPGTVVTAFVQPAGPDTWTLSVKAGSTTLAEQTVTLSAADSQSVEQSADWIVEAPSTMSGRILPLAPFGSVTFEGATVETSAGKTLSMQKAGPPSPVELASRYNGQVQPGTVVASGDAFTVTESQPPTGPSYGFGGTPLPGGGYGGGYGYRGGQHSRGGW